MGYTRHHAIVCSGPAPVEDMAPYSLGLTEYITSLQRAHNYAANIFGDTVSPIVISPVNGVGSFFVAPDGSNEGWQDSDAGDERRAAFITYLRANYYDDGSSAVHWAEVQYGDDENEAKVTQSSDFDEAAYWETHTPA